MVLGLTLIATMAFAQTKMSVNGNRRGLVKEATTQVIKAPSVDYKASIFASAPAGTKAFGNGIGDTLEGAFWNFDDTTGMVYGENAVIGANDSVMYYVADSSRWIRYGVTAHNLSAPANVFKLIPDSNYLKQHQTEYSGGWNINALIRSILDRVSTNYMMIYPCGTEFATDRNHNAYLQMPTVANPSTSNVYTIRFLQNYSKFYDRTYIDFKVGNDWYAREINVTGVDAEVNEWSDGNKSYVMPAEFGQQENLIFRFRFYNPPTTITYAALGYVWAIDNVAIVRSASKAWANSQERYVDGGYGTLPLLDNETPMNIPLAWYGHATNEGAYEIENPTATAWHSAPNGTWSELTSKVADNMPATGQINWLTLNERGFLDSIDYHGYFGMATAWNDPFDSLPEPIPAGYTRMGLPTDQIGLNKITVTVTNDDNQYAPLEFDTIGYNVVNINGGNEGLPIQGYRWGHDNGVIAKGSAYIYGRTSEGDYLSEEGNYDQPGYSVRVRYTTPDVIPTDENGKPYVIKGIEIIPRTDIGDSEFVGSAIRPYLAHQYYEDSIDPRGQHHYSYGIYSFRPEETGLDPYNSYVFDEDNYANAVNDINNVPYGYTIATGDNYRAVNIAIPGQPELEPNTAFFVGYTMLEEGNFAAAQQQNAYFGGRNAAGTRDSAYSYANTPALKAYANGFKPDDYDVILNDPAGDLIWYGGYYNPVYPMIRLIIGEYAAIPMHGIQAICPDTNIGVIYNSSLDNICGTADSAYQNTEISVYVAGAGDSSWLHPGLIDSVIIDGTTINVEEINGIYDGENFSILERSEDLKSASGQILLTRSYYFVTFSDLQDDHTVSYAGHAYPYNLGIEGEAVSVSLGMRPNPASHNVTLNMTGVTGMVNCSIIDMSGRVVYNRDINAETSHTIDLSNVAAGAYFVRVTNDSFSKVEKLIVR